jgi:hypothetical protein
LTEQGDHESSACFTPDGDLDVRARHRHLGPGTLSQIEISLVGPDTTADINNSYNAFDAAHMVVHEERIDRN